jgi:hypothetical protein
VDLVRVIPRDVVPKQTTPMSLVNENQVVEKLSATASDPAFRDSAAGGVVAKIMRKKVQAITPGVISPARFG